MEGKVPEELSEETRQLAAARAREKARIARWDLDIAVFLFATLITIVILLYQGIGIEIVAPIAIFALSMVWLVGWRRGKQLYSSFYEEELAKLEQASAKKAAPTLEETIEEKVQKALRERLR